MLEFHFIQFKKTFQNSHTPTYQVSLAITINTGHLYQVLLLDSNFLYQMLYMASHEMLNIHTNTSIKAILVTCKHRRLKSLFLIFILKGCASSQPTSLQPLTAAKIFQKIRICEQNLQREVLKQTVM